MPDGSNDLQIALTEAFARLVELHESSSVQKIITELSRKDLKVEHYANSDQPIFELIEGEGEKAVLHPLFSIPEILEKILEIGRRGVPAIDILVMEKREAHRLHAGRHLAGMPGMHPVVLGRGDEERLGVGDRGL